MARPSSQLGKLASEKKHLREEKVELQRQVRPPGLGALAPPMLLPAWPQGRLVQLCLAVGVDLSVG